MCSPSDKAVVGATRTPPREPPKNQESALKPLTTQNSTRVQMKHQDSPNLMYVKPKDKTKDSGKKQPCKHNSSSSAATATPSPEKNVSENAHIHKPRARTLGALNVHKNTHIQKPGAGALGVVNKKTRTDKPFSQNHKLVTDPPYSSIWEEFDASFRKLMDAVSLGGLKERRAGKGGSEQA
ncbi:hypothetical protein UY3_07493 [Chelonia mydas]|uniref:Uncharacterized protein n=1 Tax=Chelonia mydas TaxID=8469 RepID=M7BBM0_CHEMY|nr:hypothetical protein UY3_07493 [Chelonia mydas]